MGSLEVCETLPLADRGVFGASDGVRAGRDLGVHAMYAVAELFEEHVAGGDCTCGSLAAARRLDGDASRCAVSSVACSGAHAEAVGRAHLEPACEVVVSADGAGAAVESDLESAVSRGCVPHEVYPGGSGAVSEV